MPNPKAGLSAGEAKPAETPADDATKPAETAETETPETKPADDEAKGESTPSAETAEETPETEPEGDESPAEKEPEPAALSARQECARFIDEFGAERGAKYFAAGYSFADAQAEELKHLRAENRKLAAAQDRGEETPVSFGAEADSQDDGKPDAKLQSAVGANLGRFAAGLAKRKK